MDNYLCRFGIKGERLNPPWPAPGHLPGLPRVNLSRDWLTGLPAGTSLACRTAGHSAWLAGRRGLAPGRASACQPENLKLNPSGLISGKPLTSTGIT